MKLPYKKPIDITNFTGGEGIAVSLMGLLGMSALILVMLVCIINGSLDIHFSFVAWCVFGIVSFLLSELIVIFLVDGNITKMTHTSTGKRYVINVEPSLTEVVCMKLGFISVSFTVSLFSYMIYHITSKYLKMVAIVFGLSILVVMLFYVLGKTNQWILRHVR